ncbi:putative pyridoxine 5'-phosphate oxidase superfamily flavin-nucleotide-binding protein [Kitasatospora sp. MAA19]|uniref:pyridoxamine 5'-phosphate oxidase family protein n=1 Tax=Kitasatospora sp. MAA19 TaxID=3035090 RepID=UPI002473F27E|nr:pyridoxamine 5'-phosphate oxidase family protein [Kitasatospora sp. MAA19]MDH6703713.1 putative pyridoxine 5'-phosphate oxidase superfamily flavin-nucleotide-binding protein [Kitasatospora sp. MAA19]
MTTTSTPYHRGERAAQARAGVSERADHVGRSIRDTVPPVAARFLTERRMLVVGAADRDGRVWATQLTGPAGFLRAPDERTMAVAAHPAEADPLAEALARPARVGTIALDPAGRRRMRLNGRSTPDGRGGLNVAAEQVISNCPKYIQRRSPQDRPAAGAPRAVTAGPVLSTLQRLTAATVDTFFIATTGPDGSVDASHRGGFPGFLQAVAPDRLRWPEYPGNSMFLTLGNLELDPRAGLLLPDWETGGALLVTGEARTDWSAEARQAAPGAERTVELTVTGVLELADAAPLTWTDPEYSPANPPTRGA